MWIYPIAHSIKAQPCFPSTVQNRQACLQFAQIGPFWKKTFLSERRNDLLEVESQLNFRMAALHIALAFRGGEAVTAPAADGSAVGEELC